MSGLQKEDSHVMLAETHVPEGTAAERASRAFARIGRFVTYSAAIWATGAGLQPPKGEHEDAKDAAHSFAKEGTP